MKTNIITKASLVLGLMVTVLSFAQSTNENFIQSKKCLNDDCSRKSETITYFDGFGRAKQIIDVKSTPTAKDLVTAVTYDGYGRRAKDILPVPVATQNSAIHTGITNESAANTYYGVSNAFSEKELENSPLDRVLQQAKPGEPWKKSSGHTQKFQYEANSGSEVKKFKTVTSINTISGISSTVSELSVSADNSGFYPASTLYKNTVTDEDGNPVIRFQNGKGQTVMIRRNDGSQNVDTYYVYNEYDQLAFVLSPKAVQQITQNNNVITEAILNELCYQYRYDGQDREVEKKIPGKDWEFTVYDKHDRIVLTQDGSLRITNNTFGNRGWLFAKYDEFGRVAFTGFYPNLDSRSAIQNQVNNSSSIESRLAVPIVISGGNLYYRNLGFPSANITVLTANYYDTYPSEAPSVPPTILGQPTMSQILSSTDDASTNDALTATYVKNIEDNNWTKTYNYYDSMGRQIASNSVNHLGGYTNTETELDFAGSPLRKNTYHLRKQGEIGVTVKERFLYDTQNRLVQHFHQVDNNDEELLAENTYDELSQLINKKVGSTSGSVPLQSIDYDYDINGWLTDINKNQMSVGNLDGKLFSYKIKYASRDGIQNPDTAQFPGRNVLPKYNGNIAEVDWRAVENIGVNPPLTPKRYGYAFDKMDRLLAGYYQNPDNPYSKENTESLTYDLNGNISDLYRTSKAEYGNTTATVIDNLQYTYNGNKALNIKDNSGNPTGYEGTAGFPIDYDVNGNMTNMMDKNITGIGYNYLNLPNAVHIGFGQITNDISTKYRADGVKVRNESLKMSIGIAGTTSSKETTDYLDGFQYLNVTSSGPGGSDPGESPEMRMLKRAYEPEAFTPVGILEPTVEPTFLNVPKTAELKFFPTAEGFYDYTKNQYIYQYKDQLGNVRVSFAKNSSGTLELVDNNDYYPFGMNHLKTGLSYFRQGSYKNYKMQEQELQETGFYAYKWRNYMPDVGRFFNIDPLSEKYNTWSVYAFSGNRVIDARELEGLEPLVINRTTKNLVLVNQGWIRANPPNGATQAQNFGKVNKDGGIDYDGLGVINNLNSKTNQVGVFGSSSTENTKNDILTSIKSFRKQSPNGKLIMVGHSRGADNFIELAQENPDIKIDLLFTLDIADDWDSDQIPSNVKKAINYYNKNDGFLGSSIGGEDIEADDPSKTTILNVPVSASHTEIDNKYKYNAYNAVVNELNKKPNNETKKK
ncbi:RHS repeat-associated core domain-containing protein [Chryseobacterium arachidis]|uniref:RHS repeat-associated core domain-containing protein n=2 Tax=Chryseobacterium arachidis TaxID=1416778 RepID=A0A1M5D7Q1_9FLAO|nr:DUF6443 domain-containing protein [Chryseobacterium arachidis]SHF62692.1 RHS repeat-associated core domain-containing protein [Chryseobacterium arachidis]